MTTNPTEQRLRTAARSNLDSAVGIDVPAGDRSSTLDNRDERSDVRASGDSSSPSATQLGLPLARGTNVRLDGQPVKIEPSAPGRIAFRLASGHVLVLAARRCQVDVEITVRDTDEPGTPRESVSVV